jgi:hypothetical protein
MTGDAGTQRPRLLNERRVVHEDGAARRVRLARVDHAVQHGLEVAREARGKRVAELEQSRPPAQPVSQSGGKHKTPRKKGRRGKGKEADLLEEFEAGAHGVHFAEARPVVELELGLEDAHGGGALVDDLPVGELALPQDVDNVVGNVELGLAPARA